MTILQSAIKIISRILQLKVCIPAMSELSSSPLTQQEQVGCSSVQCHWFQLHGQGCTVFVEVHWEPAYPLSWADTLLISSRHLPQFWVPLLFSRSEPPELQAPKSPGYFLATFFPLIIPFITKTWKVLMLTILVQYFKPWVASIKTRNEVLTINAMRAVGMRGKWDPDCFLWVQKFSQAFSIILIYFCCSLPY